MGKNSITLLRAWQIFEIYFKGICAAKRVSGKTNGNVSLDVRLPAKMHCEPYPASTVDPHKIVEMAKCF